jgi:GDP-mannose 6-dehydrogenase
MDIFCQDTKLNLSSYYLKPGFAFGGSCLPKDVRALSYMARSLDLQVPVIDAILPSNRAQVEKGIEMIQATGKRRVGVLGFSFKAGTDDLRESPMVEVIERLIGKGYEVTLFDENVRMACLIGANRDYILNQIPHISRLMTEDVDALLEAAEVVVIGNGAPEFREAVGRLRPDQFLIDFIRLDREIASAAAYDGICW